MRDGRGRMGPGAGQVADVNWYWRSGAPRITYSCISCIIVGTQNIPNYTKQFSQQRALTKAGVKLCETVLKLFSKLFGICLKRINMLRSKRFEICLTRWMSSCCFGICCTYWMSELRVLFYTVDVKLLFWSLFTYWKSSVFQTVDAKVVICNCFQ